MTKRTYQINTNRGLDLSSSPLGVAPSRASYMRNMISREGINHKRNGWKEITSFECGEEALPVKGIWEFGHPETKEKSIIVHAGKQFFKCSEDFSKKEKIDIQAGITINDNKCKGYCRDGLLWLIGCGDFLVYNGTSIIRVEDSEYAYAPTTAIGITGAGQIKAFEDINLLTNRRRNKIIGEARYIESNQSFHSAYALDGRIAFEETTESNEFKKPVKVTVEIAIGNYTDNKNEVTVLARLTDGSKKELTYKSIVTLEYEVANGEVEVDYSKATYNGEEVELYTHTTDENGATTEKTYEAKIILQEWPQNHVLACFSNVVTPYEGYNNITVEYYADYKRDIDLTSSAVLTQANGVDILLVANKDNAVFYSGLDSADCDYIFGYLSVEKFITLGSDTEAISAIVPMADSVGVFKGNSLYRISFTFKSDSATYEADYVPQITKAIDTINCINQFANCNVNGDTLVFSGNGVFGIEYSSSQRSLKLRSSNINNAFKKYTAEQLNNAISCEHEGRYYLFIDGDAYIADSRFKSYESNRLDTSFEYEWWYFDNCPTLVACSVYGKLYLGKENGKIAVFDDKFTDREYVVAKAKDGTISCKDGYIFTFDDALGVEDGDKISLKNCYRLLGEFKTELTSKGVIVKGLKEGAYIGMPVFFDNTKIEHKIIDFDFNSQCFVIDAPSCQEKETIYTYIGDIEYTIDEIDNEKKYYLYSEGNEEIGPIKLIHFDELEATIHKRKNVECEYHTPVTDLGSNLSLKILNQLSITVSQETKGHIEIGYQTNNNNVFKKRNIGGAFDFDSFDFNTFAFDGAFYKTHIKRVFERNFNYIFFKFASKSDSDFAIENFTCVYSSNNKLLRSDR